MTVTRQRSPEYPNFSLRRAVQRAEAIFKADRKNPIDRAVAAQHMGYGGKSGSADKALATMQHYGLLDRVGKGELRVSQRTVDIIHPADPADRKRALAEAAFTPSLFKALKDRFPDGVSAETLRSYLVRENFLDRAIAPITSAYTDTCAYLKQENAYENGGASESLGPPSLDLEDEEEERGTPEEAQVGDLVTVEREGVLVFPTPVRVLDVKESGGATWVWTDGSDSWTQMDTVAVVSKAEPTPPPPLTPPARPSFQQAKPSLHAEAGTVMRTAVFPLPEGDASITFPAVLSPESLNLLGHYLHLTVQQAKWAKKAAPILYSEDEKRSVGQANV